MSLLVVATFLTVLLPTSLGEFYQSTALGWARPGLTELDGSPAVISTRVRKNNLQRPIPSIDQAPGFYTDISDFMVIQANYTNCSGSTFEAKFAGPSDPTDNAVVALVETPSYARVSVQLPSCFGYFKKEEMANAMAKCIGYLHEQNAVAGCCLFNGLTSSPPNTGPHDKQAWHWQMFLKISTDNINWPVIASPNIHCSVIPIHLDLLPPEAAQELLATPAG